MDEVERARRIEIAAAKLGWERNEAYPDMWLQEPNAKATYYAVVDNELTDHGLVAGIEWLLARGWSLDLDPSNGSRCYRMKSESMTVWHRSLADVVLMALTEGE